MACRDTMVALNKSRQRVIDSRFLSGRLRPPGQTGGVNVALTPPEFHPGARRSRVIRFMGWDNSDSLRWAWDQQSLWLQAADRLKRNLFRARTPGY